MKSSKLYAAGAGIVLLSSTALATSLTGAAVANGGHHKGHHSELEAHLVALNNSGVMGEAEVEVKHHKLDVEVEASGVLANAPHAQHIHFGAQAAHECPTVANDANHDFRLTTGEGLPSYGPIAVSLTTKGDTSPDSALAVDRFPTAPMGMIDYDRHTMTSDEVAEAIRNGEAVVVIHGIDYNNNGMYDFDAAGASDIAPDLPAEATDPVACGVLKMD